MFLSLPLPRPFTRPSTLAASSSSLPTEVPPPALRQAPHGAWRRALFWLLAPSPLDCATAVVRLQPVRNDFSSQIADIDGDEARALRRRIADAPTLRELWHLRSAVYRVIGIARSQAEAGRRLERLNRHFPTRSPRSQFGSP